MKEIKAFFVAAFAVLSSWLGILAVPFLVLVGLNVTDYITGLAASKYRGQPISSYKGLRGIIKKICMWLLVAVGGVLDWLLMYAGETVGIDIKFKFMIACVVAIWLICNEIISILENIKDIGAPLPSWLMKITQNIKSQVDNKVSEDSKAEISE